MSESIIFLIEFKKKLKEKKKIIFKKKFIKKISICCV